MKENENRNEDKSLSYNRCNQCAYWDGKICIITKEETTEDTPCSDDKNFWYISPSLRKRGLLL